MKKIIILLCIIHCALCTNINAQTDYPIVEKNGEKYYEYTINPGDGLFAIARKFGIKQNDLHKVNENLSTNLKVGDKILIPIETNITNEIDKTVTTHVVEAKQTLYSISKLYNVSIDTLIALNPSAKTGIKTGETLIISKNKSLNKSQDIPRKINTAPTTENITHFVQKKETLFSISKLYNIAIHDLIELNPELQNGLKAGTTIIIKKGNNLSEQQEQNSHTIQKEKNEQITTSKQKENKKTTPIDTISISTNNHTNSSNNTFFIQDSAAINIVYLLPLIPTNANDEKNLQRFIEFYRGSILALNDAKEEGLSANIYTYNLPKSSNKIDSILNLLNDKQIDVIIGPAYSEQTNKVLSYTKKHNITTIIPFSNKIDSAYYFPKLIQFNPPQDFLFNNVIENTFAHRNLQYILAYFKNCNNKGNALVNDFAQILNANSKNFNQITITPEDVDSIKTMLTSDTTILVLGSTLINDVVPVIDSLNRYQLPQLQIWGFEEWGANTIKKYPQTLYYSLFNSNETEKYKNDYNNWFGVRKQTVGAKYDLLGYDLTMIALKGIKTSNDNLIINPQMSDIKFLQSEPQLEFIDNRWLNTNYYLFFWDNITIKEIKN